MPRGSKPGERRGGRQRGTPNKKTVLRNEAISAAGSNPDISPLEFMLGVMRDCNVPAELRIKVAQAAAPYVHAKPGITRSGEPETTAKLVEGGSDFATDPALVKALRDDKLKFKHLFQKRVNPSQNGGPPSESELEEESRLSASIAERARAMSCPEGYGEQQARKDRDRLSRLESKRRSTAPGTSGVLTHAEDAEEAQLTARVLAYEQSPEGRARRRIFELILKTFSRDGVSVAEQDELDDLQRRYPNPPLDPRLKDSFEALRTANEHSASNRMSRAGLLRPVARPVQKKRKENGRSYRVNAKESEGERSGIIRRQFCGARQVGAIFRGALKTFSRDGVSVAEQDELDDLQRRYPDPPLDPRLKDSAPPTFAGVSSILERERIASRRRHLVRNATAARLPVRHSPASPAATVAPGKRTGAFK